MLSLTLIDSQEHAMYQANQCPILNKTPIKPLTLTGVESSKHGPAELEANTTLIHLHDHNDTAFLLPRSIIPSLRYRRCNKMYCQNRSGFSGPSGSRPPPVRVPVPVTCPWPWCRPEPGWEIPTLVPVGISRRWDEPT